MTYKFRLLSLSILITLVMSGCAPPTPAQTQTPEPTLTTVPSQTPTLPPTHTPARFETADCALFRISVRTKTECGYLFVPEDRTQPNSPLIQLAVAIVRSSSPNPAPDPIVFLQGGPGVNALDMLTVLSTIYNVSPFYDFLADHDLIVFDQRGVGYSTPSLNCPEVEKQTYEDLSLNLSREEAQQNSIQAFQACHDRLLKEGRNLAAYTSSSNAADVNDLRLALGYAEWNLYGVSYGTRLALTVMRDFPEGVRSVILDSVYPPQVDGYAEKVGNAERALNLLFDRCAANPLCNATYPELKTIFYDTVDHLDSNPITLPLTHPATGKRYDLLINGDGFIGLIFNLIYFTDALPNLPGFIFAIHEGRLDYLDTRMKQFLSSFVFQGDYFSEGMYISIQCNEEASFSSPQAVTMTNATVSPRFQDAFTSIQPPIFEICAVWDSKRASAIENQSVVNDIPTLI
jgi:pimeloyl-ACP methyl ester carboxylesterase